MNRIVIAIAVSSACTVLSTAAQAATAYPQSDAAARKQISGLAVPFVGNAGQWEPGVAFAAQTFAGSLAVGKDGRLVYHLPASEGAASGSTMLSETLVDHRGHAVVSVPSGVGVQMAQVSYIVGRDPAKHRSGLATYGQVGLGEVYPGIDVRLRATGTNVEKIFTVAPGIDAGAIRLRVGGARRVEIGSAGELVAHTASGPVAYTAPVAFQHDDQGVRRSVPVRYALAGNEYGFAVGDYDRSRPLVIDPLLQSTYLTGSTGRDGIFAMVLHPSSGELIVAGRTAAADFPCTTAGGICANGGQPGHAASGYDGFVARVSGDLTTLLQATYFGGDAEDVVNAVAVNPATGEIIAAGETASGNVPCMTGAGACTAAQPVSGGGTDGFVARFSPDLQTLRLATYFGGSGTDSVKALAIGASGAIYAAGTSSSTNLPCAVFSAVTGCQTGAQSIASATNGGFVARFSADLTSLVQTTYGQAAYAMVILPATGDLITGGSAFTAALPCTTAGVPAGCLDAAQPLLAGSGDGFLARYSATLVTLRQATYLGGGGNDQINALAIHPINGDLYVGGSTEIGVFPCTTAPCGAGGQSVFGGGLADGFVARLNPSLTVPITQATYLGGSSDDRVIGLAIHPVSGEVYAVGQTASPNFPCVSAGTNGCSDGPISTAANMTGVQVDGFVIRLSPDLHNFVQGSLTSDHSGATGSITSASNAARAVVFRAAGTEVVVAGETGFAICSTASPACGAGGAQSTFLGIGATDAFIERFSFDLTVGDTSPNPFAFVPQVVVPVSTSRTSNPVLIAGINEPAKIYLEGQAGSTYCVSTQNNCNCDVTNNLFVGTPGFVQPGNYVCVRHTSSSAFPVLTRTGVHIGTGFANFDVTTGPAALCSLDVDGDNKIDPLTDGLLIIRALFGLKGDAVTAGAVGNGAARPLWSQIQQYLNDHCGTTLAP